MQKLRGLRFSEYTSTHFLGEKDRDSALKTHR